MEIDQALKQRLIGAAVITALAAIFIPMLFDDPVEVSGQAISSLKIPPVPNKVFETSSQSVQTSVEKVLATPEPAAVINNKEAIPVATPKQAELPKQKQVQFSRWIIQAGSFKQKENAQTFMETLRKQGFTAFFDTYKTKQANILYRVRVGPELDKKRAEAMQKKLDKRNNIKSMLVKE